MATQPRKGPRWIDYVPVDDVPDHVDNPKTHSDVDLDSSLERFDFTEPLLIDERTGVLASGHGRKAMVIRARDAAKATPDGIVVKAGVWHVPVVRGWSSKDDAELKAYLVAANHTTEAGGWANAKLAPILDELRATPMGLAGTAYTSDEVDALLADLRPPDFRPEPPDANPRLDVRNPIVCPSCGHSFHRV